jgi:hypothetical protein
MVDVILDTKKPGSPSQVVVSPSASIELPDAVVRRLNESVSIHVLIPLLPLAERLSSERFPTLQKDFFCLIRGHETCHIY